MSIYLVNPSEHSFGAAVVTPRWLYVLAAATPEEWGTPCLIDEALDRFDPTRVGSSDVVGIGIHTLNALHGYEIGRAARDAGATVIYGGVHASLYPDEGLRRGAANAVVTGDGEEVWPAVLQDLRNGELRERYDGGRIGAPRFRRARWDLLPSARYMMASVQTVRGCPKHCSFCSVWRMDGQKPRLSTTGNVIDEIVELRRLGFRFLVLADDNFYPVTLRDVELARKQDDEARLNQLLAIREERFDLMERMARLPPDMHFFTQITMEAADDLPFLEAMKKARVHGAVVGVESITPEGLKFVYKDFNETGEDLVKKLRRFREYRVHILGSFMFGLPSDRPETFTATIELARTSELDFAQFGTITPFPGTLDFLRWEKDEASQVTVEGVPLNRFWLLPKTKRPRLLMPHPTMSPQEVRQRAWEAWQHFYSLRSIWARAVKLNSDARGRVFYFLASMLFLKMYGGTGFATDSARSTRAARWARWIARWSLPLFRNKPMPGLQVPKAVASAGVQAT